MNTTSAIQVISQPLHTVILHNATS